VHEQPHIPREIKDDLRRSDLPPALWYVGPLQDGRLRPIEGPGTPLRPLPLEPRESPSPALPGPLTPGG